jgi:16S rRNA (uracil1498-N3)-methyltransferase
MRAPVFLVGADQLTGERIVLSGPEGRHAATVRRLEPGERADVTDGSGAVAQCRVVARRDGELELEVLGRRLDPPPDPWLTVLQALPKGDRGELAVETMTEVGVDVIVPWAADRCVVQWRGERGDRALARWRSAGLAAAKQARRARFPEIAGPAGRADAAGLVAGAGLAILLDPEADLPLAGLAAKPLGAEGGGIVLIVGPEGGVSPAETDLLTGAGAVPARLGPSVLRASTAGAVAAAIVLSDSGRWA